MPANTTELEKRLWSAADELRANSGLKSSEYSVPVLGLIFLRYADEYNAGSANVETWFAKLMAFMMRLKEEEKRGIAEQLSEEELVIFDLLTKPAITLSKQETAEVKRVARSLLEKLTREKLVLDWRKQQTTRAMVLVTIQDILNQLPRAYSKGLYEQKCEAVYQHFYEAYVGQGKSVYAAI